MTVAGNRLVCFAGSAVAVEYKSDRAARVVDFLFRHLPTGNGSATPPHATYRVAPGDGSGRLALYRDDELSHQGTSDAYLAEKLLGDVGYTLADKSRGGLLFHAGALAWSGRGLLLPGSVGAGKTTLTMWLALKRVSGLEYLSDEMVFFSTGSHTMQTYTRPLNLKSPARTALKDLFDFKGHAGRILSTSYGDLIPPELLCFAGPRQEIPVHLIIFPHYVAGSKFELQPLTKAQAGLALMECLVNARNLPEHGFPDIARLARRSPAYRLRYARFDEIGEHIETLLRMT
jgi:hypothetical protein